MRLLIRMSSCTNGVHLSKLKVSSSCRLLRLDHHHLNLSATFCKKRLWSSSSLRPSVWSQRRSTPLLCLHRTVPHTPVAFAGSSAKSESENTRKDTDLDQTPTAVPLEDVKRILRLAYSERWKLAGRLLLLSWQLSFIHLFVHSFIHSSLSGNWITVYISLFVQKFTELIVSLTHHEIRLMFGHFFTQLV